MENKIQLLTLQEFARKYKIKDPYDTSEYDYIAAYKRNITPDSSGKWPRLENNE